MKFKYLIICLLHLFISILNSYSQKLSDKTCRRQEKAWIALSALTIGTHAALYKTWYSQETMQPFHWTNDNLNWLQMDKAGHVYSAYNAATAASAVFRLSGYSRKKSALLGAGFSMAFQTPIEYLDGRSREWGASSGDILANTVGTLAAGIQNWHWGNARVPIRVTFHGSPYARIRPGLLGSSIPERLLKDYNGQTYWVDLNPERMRARPGFWPKWLGINLGYGADGMLGGDDNRWIDNEGKIQDYSNISRFRQYYIGPSISFGYLKNHRKKGIRALAYVTDKIRLPLPVLEFGKNQSWTFHYFYR